jgi:hypothetical protein
MRLRITALLSLLLLLSCEKDVSDQFRESKHSMFVISCIATAGESPLINLTRSSTLIEIDSLWFLNNALLELESGDQSYLLNSVGEGFYTQENHSLEAGNSYTIRCSGEELPNASVNFEVPPYPNISEFSFAVDDSFFFSLDLEISDPAQTDDYYSFSISGWKTEVVHHYNSNTGEERTDTSNVYINYPVLQRDPVFEYCGRSEYFEVYDHKSVFNEVVHFSDKQFDGKTHTLSLKGPLSWFYNDSIPEINIHLVKRDAHYFKFLESIILYDPYNDLPITQPVQIYSNIEGGFGLLTAKSPLTYTIDMSEWYNNPEFLKSLHQGNQGALPF